MSIRVKIILTYAILVIISASVLIFSGIALLTKVVFESTSAVINERDIPVVITEVIDLLSDIKQAHDYEPENLVDAEYIRGLNERTEFYNGGIVVRYGNNVYNYSGLPDETGFTSQLQKSISDEDFHEDDLDDNVFSYEEKSYFYIDYEFDVKGKEAIYFFVVDITKPEHVGSSSGNAFMTVLGVLLLIITLPLLIILTNDIIKPIRMLEDGVKHINSGDLDFKLRTKKKNEIGQVINSFDVMRRKLKHSIEKQIQFEENRKELLLNIGHDLKTPITSIKGHVEGIRDGVANTPEKLDKYLNVIYQKSQDMDQLIDDLFLFSKLDLDNVPFEMSKVKVRPFITDIVSEMRLGWENEHQILNLNMNIEDIDIIIDHAQIKRVLVNIIQNSMKYIEKEDKKIDITVNESKKFVQIVIADNGIGIDENHLNNIFDRFYRVDESRNLATGGTGLGLAISKQIINKHGGNIFATSELSLGTKMVIELGKVKDV